MEITGRLSPSLAHPALPRQSAAIAAPAAHPMIERVLQGELLSEAAPLGAPSKSFGRAHFTADAGLMPAPSARAIASYLSYAAPIHATVPQIDDYA